MPWKKVQLFLVHFGLNFWSKFRHWEGSTKAKTLNPFGRRSKYIPAQRQLRRYTYVSKIVWFRYDYGMMVWKWYDCMTSVWWFVSCVCEWRKCKQLWIKYTHFFLFSSNYEIQHKALPQVFGFCNFFISQHDLRISWRPLKTSSLNLQSWLGLMLCVLVYPWRPWRAKVFFFILSFINNI